MKAHELKEGDILEGETVTGIEDTGFLLKVYTDGTEAAFPGAQKAVWMRRDAEIEDGEIKTPFGGSSW